MHRDSSHLAVLRAMRGKKLEMCTLLLLLIFSYARPAVGCIKQYCDPFVCLSARLSNSLDGCTVCPCWTATIWYCIVYTRACIRPVVIIQFVVMNKSGPVAPRSVTWSPDPLADPVCAPSAWRDRALVITWPHRKQIAVDICAADVECAGAPAEGVVWTKCGERHLSSSDARSREICALSSPEISRNRYISTFEFHTARRDECILLVVVLIFNTMACLWI